MLHARILGIKLPTGEKTFFKAPVPKRFKQVLAYFKEHYKKWSFYDK